MSIELHFTEDDWARIAADWSAWWAGELPRPLVMIQGWQPAPGAARPGAPWFINHLPCDMPADQVIDIYQTDLEATRCYGDAWPKWWPNLGPGIIAAFLGSEVCAGPDTVWFEPIAAAGIADLRLAYNGGNAWWQRVRELTRTAVQRWGRAVCVGFTDLGGNLDILAHLRSTQPLLLDLLDAPDEVAGVLGEITRLWLRYYDELYAIVAPAGRGTSPWAAIWSSGRCYMLQSDFSYMISPKMFERFVAPDLAACCAKLDHAFYHLDGKGQISHLDVLLAIEGLHGIQWIPGAGAPPPEEWLPLLKRIRDAGKLCQLYVSPPGARAIVKALGGRGFAFYITEAMSQDTAQDFLATLARERP